MRKKANLSAHVAPVGRQRVGGKIRNGDLRGPNWSPLFVQAVSDSHLERSWRIPGTKLTLRRTGWLAVLIYGIDVANLLYKGRQKWLFKRKETSWTFFFVISAVLIYLFEGSWILQSLLLMFKEVLGGINGGRSQEEKRCKHLHLINEPLHIP